MKGILEKLRRDGFSLGEDYRYVGTNPHVIRQKILASADTEEFVWALDAFCFAIVSNLFGTKIASSGFSDKKSKKFKDEAIRLVSCAKECWAALENSM